jgi:hypothetical protein
MRPRSTELQSYDDEDEEVYEDDEDEDDEEGEEDDEPEDPGWFVSPQAVCLDSCRAKSL